MITLQRQVPDSSTLKRTGLKLTYMHRLGLGAAGLAPGCPLPCGCCGQTSVKPYGQTDPADTQKDLADLHLVHQLLLEGAPVAQVKNFPK